MIEPESVWSDPTDAGSRGSGSIGSAGSAGRGSGPSAGSSGVSQRSSRGTDGSGSRPRSAKGELHRGVADAHFCSFHLGGQLFALDVDAVGEVFSIERLVRVPRAPDGVIGLTNLRGSALAVVDLAVVLNLQVERADAQARGNGHGLALVLNLDGMRTAAAIDAVESVFPVRTEDVRASDALEEHPSIEGFLELGDGRLVNVLDRAALAERIGRIRMFSGADTPELPARSG